MKRKLHFFAICLLPLTLIFTGCGSDNQDSCVLDCGAHGKCAISTSPEPCTCDEGYEHDNTGKCNTSTRDKFMKDGGKTTVYKGTLDIQPEPTAIDLEVSIDESYPSYLTLKGLPMTNRDVVVYVDNVQTNLFHLESPITLTDGKQLANLEGELDSKQEGLTIRYFAPNSTKEMCTFDCKKQ